MLGRIVAVIVLVVSLALIYLAPQGLLTKPISDDAHTGPYLLELTADTMALKDARYTALDQCMGGERLPVVLSLGLMFGELGIPGCMIADTSITARNLVTDTLLIAGLDTISDITSAAPSAGYALWPASQSIIVSFPLRGNWSPRLGSWKVYRGLVDELRQNGLDARPVLEIYDPATEEIRYVMSLDSTQKDEQSEW